MQKSKKIMIILLSISLFFVPATIIFADQSSELCCMPHSIYGRVYIDGELAPNNVRVNISFSNDNKSDIIDNDCGEYYIDFFGNEFEKGSFSVYYKQKWYTPKENTSIIINCNVVEYQRDLYIVTSQSQNIPPKKPFNPTPSDDDNHVELVDQTVEITVTAIDPDDDRLTVRFYNATNSQSSSLIGSKKLYCNQQIFSINWKNLSYGTKYQWYAVADDGENTNTSETWTFTTCPDPTSNTAPNKPTSPTPSHGESNVSLHNKTVNLTVTVSDPDGDSLNVTFYNESDEKIDSVLNVANGTTASLGWKDLAFNQTYSWYVMVNDSQLENQSDSWSFTTQRKQEESNESENHQPHCPKLINPFDKQQNVGLPPKLTVFVEDPDDDLLTVSFYDEQGNCLDTTKGKGQVSTDWNGLSYDSTYHWYVTVSDEQYTLQSATWSFSTQSTPDQTPFIPRMPQCPMPADDSKNVPQSTELRWNTCLNPDTYPTEFYTLYLGKNPSELTMVQNDLTQPCYQFNQSLINEYCTMGDTVYWQVNSTDEKGNYKRGPIWQFSIRTSEPEVVISDVSDGDNGLHITVFNEDQNTYAANVDYELTFIPLDDCTLYEPINNKSTGSVFRIAPRHSEIINSGEVIGYGHVNVQIKVGDETKNLACFVTMDHISILGEHQAPIADAGGPYSGYVHEPITFDASNSIDPDGSISLYEWDFDNDGIFEEKQTIPTFQHTFSIADKHSVRLRVTDVNDYQSVDTVTVDVFSEKNWLFLLYMDADNNLGDIANKDFQELIDAAPFAENVHILVLKDDLGPDNTRLYYIDSSHDSEMRLMPDWLDSEENMGNHTTLSDFLTWAYTYYQADNMFLTLWDHGDGWRGVCADETSNDYLNLSELDAVFSTGPFSDEKLNILGFADCSMATMATYYQLHEHTDFFIGSEQTGWGSTEKGLPWQFTHLIQQMNTTNHPSIVTINTVENMTHQINNSSLENKSHTWSVVRSNQLVQLQQCLDEIADGLLTVIENQETYKIEEIYQQTEQYGETIDLYHFIQQISNASFSSISSDLINQTVSQFTNTVISNQVHQGKGSDAISVTHAHGLAVYFPETYDSEYDNLKISTGQWDDFLRAYLGM